MKRFVVNGKEYKAKTLDFNTICELEDMGVSLENASDKPMSLVRAYFSVCANKGKEFAGKELEAHVIAGGKLDEIMSIFFEEMEKSDFFRNLNETAEEEDSENQEEKSEKK